MVDDIRPFVLEDLFDFRRSDVEKIETTFGFRFPRLPEKRLSTTTTSCPAPM
jgi:hypothetical protein